MNLINLFYLYLVSVRLRVRANQCVLVIERRKRKNNFGFFSKEGKQKNSTIVSSEQRLSSLTCVQAWCESESAWHSRLKKLSFCFEDTLAPDEFIEFAKIISFSASTFYAQIHTRFIEFNLACGPLPMPTLFQQRRQFETRPVRAILTMSLKCLYNLRKYSHFQRASFMHKSKLDLLNLIWTAAPITTPTLF